jgi:hypothetical protein
VAAAQTPPRVTDIDAIAALGDPVLRNLRITQSYSDLSRALAARTGGVANWCTFATWASRQAGRTIRKEDLPQALEHAVDEWIGEGGADAVVHAARSLGASRAIGEIRAIVRSALDLKPALARASDAVARGNRKVFAEIGREFARFLTECADAAVPAPDRIERFVQALRPGEPPDGQAYLRQAFPRYYRLLFARDHRTQAEQMLLANLEIGLHEQTRLQPEIESALDAGVVEPRELAATLLAKIVPRSGAVARARQFVMHLLGARTLFDVAVEVAVAGLRERVRRVITDHFLTIELSTRHRVRLGDDLQAAFPASLAHLSDPELLALLARIDPTPDSVRESGAGDWASLPERMHFIADLFRFYQECADLFDAPFEGGVES